jgi:hypothetical protein
MHREREEISRDQHITFEEKKNNVYTIYNVLINIQSELPSPNIHAYICLKYM